MANSSSEDLDDSIPDIVYQCISIIDGSTCGKKDECYLKCPLCKEPGKSFFCAECVRNGNFLHSKKKCFERFADKKVTRYKLDAEKTAILQRYEDLLSKKRKAENLKLEIYKSREKIQLLKASIQSCRGAISKEEKLIQELRNKNSQSLSDQSRFTEKLFKMRRHQKGKTTELDFITRRLDSAHSALQTIVQIRIQELITHIFPINKVSSHYCKSCSAEAGQCAELEEAQKTTYVKGQWVIAGSDIEDIQYSIVEPCIPGSGDYSAYTNWCCADHIQGISRDNLSAADKCQFDKAHGISAALAYTAQLVSILAFYMNAHVPKKSSFSDFCGHESSRTKFLHKVAKLNANVISLCLTQGVDMSKLSAHQTIHNLLLLLKSEMGELNSTISEIEIEELMESIEDSLSRDMLTIDESDSDELEADYVHVSEEEFLSVPDQPAAEPAPVQSSLVSSVISLFKAAAGQR